jgi:hypothetical protein
MSSGMAIIGTATIGIGVGAADGSAGGIAAAASVAGADQISAACRACRLSDARPLGASTEPRRRLLYLTGPKALRWPEAVREPSESYSDAILRLAEMETTDE